jgi:hypothetical protein
MCRTRVLAALLVGLALGPCARAENVGNAPAPPQAGYRINWQDTITRSLYDCIFFNEFGIVAARNWASPANNATPNGSWGTKPSWASTIDGYGSSVTVGSSWEIPNHGNIAAGDFTIHVLFQPKSWPYTYTALYDTSNREESLFIDTSGNASFLGVGTSSGAWTATFGLTTGKVWSLVIRRSGSTVSGWVNGTQNGTTASNSATTADSGVMSLGGNPSTGGSGNYMDGTYLAFEVWTRALSGDEIRRLARDPWCMVAGRRPEFMASVSAAAAAAVKFRKTLSPIGTRTGSRQTQGGPQ